MRTLNLRTDSGTSPVTPDPLPPQPEDECPTLAPSLPTSSATLANSFATQCTRQH
ncbi:hypothetical protein BT69DRAFT_1283953 [Atractiella rhizophila]|nr:hypothetical protein BT69DRAFT_1283953 [Atractiella rhizophila]